MGGEGRVSKDRVLGLPEGGRPGPSSWKVTSAGLAAE